jgi:hypothetical protein
MSFTGVILTAATVLIAGTATPARAADSLDAPMVLAATLVSADGDGCGQPAVQLGDGWLGVQAQTGGDTSLQVSGSGVTGQPSTETGCTLQVHLELDQPATVKPSQYLLSGSVSTSAGTTAGRYFESSFDGVSWYGQRSTAAAGAVGPFHQGGGSRFDPSSACGTELDLSFRVGLSLTSASGLAAGDGESLDAPAGAQVELATSACS